MEYIVHGSKNQIDSSIFTYFGAIWLCVKRIRRFDLLTTDLGQQIETSYSFHSNRSKVRENTTINKPTLLFICTFLIVDEDVLTDSIYLRLLDDFVSKLSIFTLWMIIWWTDYLTNVIYL